MFIVYSKSDGNIWREVDNYEKGENGELLAGMGGETTLVYPASVNVDVLKLTNAEFSALGEISGYIVSEGAVVPRPVEEAEVISDE